MKIVTAKSGNILQRSSVDEAQGLVLPFHEAMASEFLIHPVDMNCRQPTGIGNINLGEGQMEAALV